MRVGIWKAEVLFLPHYSPFFAQWVEQLWKEASWLLSRGTHWWASLEEKGLAVDQTPSASAAHSFRQRGLKSRDPETSLLSPSYSASGEGPEVSSPLHHPHLQLCSDRIVLCYPFSAEFFCNE